MISSRSFPLCLVACLVFLCPVASLAQLAAPAVRIVNSIDESQRVTLGHTVHPLANAANDRGAAPDGMRMERIQLALQRSSAQESALRQLLAQMNTPGSSSYHQWLTPEQFGAQFGPADQDIAAVESWLGNHGFTVTGVNPGRGSLEFAGSVAQLRDAFHTQIHKYVVNGETHYANANDPQIPAALAPVIGGFASLNNFRPRSYLQKLGKATLNPASREVTPGWTWGTSSGKYFVLAPSDYAVQYDLSPLYTAGTKGDGQTIAIINESNINIDLVNQFRTLFGLPANPPQIIIAGNDPGIDGINNPDGPNGASVEAYLDVEWAGAVAPNATIDLVIGADTSLESGLVLAMEEAVYANVAPVLSISFGECESALGSTNSFLNTLWEQAAAQGQTVMVSSGDNGSAGCDNDNTEEYAVYGQAVNGFASTPWNVAVGGTDFYYSDYASGAASISSYWSTSPTQLPAASIKSYVPEQPWNNSQYGLNAYNVYTSTGSTTIVGGSGGASNAAVCSTGAYSSSTGACTGTVSGYAKPAWQTGTGVPSDGVRDLPDVSLFAANGDNYSFYPICATDGDCQTSGLGSSGLVQFYGVGGTSASSPAFAGIMALVNQKWGRQGQADNVLYALKAQVPAAFHDITQGTISMPCEIAPTATANCISVTSPIRILSGSTTITEGQIGSGSTPEYNAAAGYNLATGLGAIDASVLVNNWNNVTRATSAVTLSASQTSFAHGASITVSGAVTGSGTPAGNVALMTDSTEPLEQGQGVFPLTSGAYSNASVNYLPGGSYHIWTSYGGDNNNAANTSPKIPITVTPETPGMDLNLFDAALGRYYTASSNPGTSVDYGSQLMVSAMVAPTSQIANLQSCTILGTNCSSLGTYTQPTGTVTFTDNSSSIATAVMNAEGDGEYNAPFAVGSHSVSATYNGDQSYNTINAPAPIAFTVVKDSPVAGIDASNRTSSGAIISGQPTVVNVVVENYAQYEACYSTSTSSGSCYVAPVAVLPPTGTVTLSSSPGGFGGSATLSAGVDPGTKAQLGVATITLPSTLAAGTYTVTLTYSGDGNYSGGSYSMGSFSVIKPSTKSTTTVATVIGSISPNSTITVTGTVTGSGTTAPTGGVIFYSSGNYLGEVSVSPGSGTVSSFSASLSSQDLVQGANFIDLQYTGDSTYAPSEYTLSAGSAIQNPLADFTLVPNTTIVPVSISSGASTGQDTINVASVNGFSGTVNLTCAATTPLTCSVSPNASLSAGNATASTLTISVPASASDGNYNVAVTGTDAATGEFIHTLAITAVVSGAGPGETLTNSGGITVARGATTGNTSTITVTPSGGFTGTVNLTCAVTSSPSGAANPITCDASNLNPTSVTITGTTALTSTLTVNTTSTTTTGSYQITVTGTSGTKTSATVVNVSVNLPADFSLGSSGAITTTAGATSGNTSTVTITPNGGFSSTVTLSCAVTTAPSGASNPLTCGNSNLNPISVTPVVMTTSTLTASTSLTTTTGAYVITVTGTSGSIVHTTTVGVTVNPVTPTFTVSATSPSAINRGGSASSTVTVSNGGTGYAGSVALSCALTSGPTNQSGNAPSCSIASGSPVTLTASTTSGTATATVTTVAATAGLVRPNFGRGKGWLDAGGGAVLAVLLFFGIPARRRSWRSMLGIVVAMIALGALASCGGGGSSGGGGGSSNSGTASGSYVFTVTGTGTPSISPAPAGTFTVVVN
ncbi:MAG: protease pro-enzyme activation domain-containing protein [Terracidiphilus sp.]|jgi:subtilase family serine protease